MKINSSSVVIGFIIGLLVGTTLGWFIHPAGQPPGVTLKTAGSTTVFPLSVAWSNHYYSSTQGEVKVEASTGGTGFGQASTVLGSVDFGAASSYKDPVDYGAATNDQIKTIPIAADAIAVVCNPLVNGTGEMQLTREHLIPIFQGAITTWEDLEAQFGLTVAATGTIQVYVRSDASGTTATYTKWLGNGEYSTYNWTLGDDELINWPSLDSVHAIEGNPGVSNGVLGDSNGIGYVSFAFLENLAAVTLYNEGNDEWIIPSPEAAKLAIPNPITDLGDSLFDSSVPGAYPVARLIFYLVNTEPPLSSFLRTQYNISPPYGVRAEAVTFLEWALSATGGQSLPIIREEVGYLEITNTGAELYALEQIVDLEPFVQPVSVLIFQLIILVQNVEKS
ncbi:MAG: PstS family phosphate ABC transporter substrate-binding protein [Promethearchaeota archaeon]